MQEGFYFKSYRASERLETRGDKTIELDYTVSVHLVEARNGEFITAIKTRDFKKNDQTPDDESSAPKLPIGLTSYLPVTKT